MICAVHRAQHSSYHVYKHSSQHLLAWTASARISRSFHTSRYYVIWWVVCSHTHPQEGGGISSLSSSSLGHEEEGFQNMSVGHILSPSRLPRGVFRRRRGLPAGGLQPAGASRRDAPAWAPSGGLLAAGQLRASAGNCAAGCACIRRR